MIRNMTIQAKLLSALILIIVISVVSGGIILSSVSNANRAVDTMQRTSDMEAAVSKFEIAIMSAHQHIANYVNTGDLQQKNLFEQVLATIPALNEELAQNIESPELLGRLGSIKADYDLWLKTIADRQIQLMRSPATVDMARLLEMSEENEILWDQIHGKFTSTQEEFAKLVHEKSAELHKTIDRTSTFSAGGVFLTIVTTLGAAVFIVFMVSKPLKALVGSTNALVRREWSAAINGAERGDEIGQMAKALLQFRDGGIENERLLAIQEKDNAVRLQRARKIEELVNLFRQNSAEVTRALEDATRKMTDSSMTMSSIANDTSLLSEEVSLSAQRAGDNVNNVAAASEELTASIREIGQQLNNTNQMAADVKDISNNTVERMRILENSANEIGTVIQIISDIAEQTNLLALNATIEAARAGEAGKGFAVVAHEVKTLASETAKATDQVRSQIDRIQNDTLEAVSFIEKISSSIENLVKNMTAIAAAMEEQTSATQEISRNVTEASGGTDAVVQSICSVSDATRKTQETSKSVNDIADELSKHSDRLKNNIDSFISNIKAA